MVQTFNPTHPKAQISLAVEGRARSSSSSSGAKYRSVPACIDVVVKPVSPDSRKICASPKSQILGFPLLSISMLLYILRSKL